VRRTNVEKRDSRHQIPLRALQTSMVRIRMRIESVTRSDLRVPESIA